jgi:UDP-glucose 4-epimerase
MSYILITGGLGFIGSHTIIELLQENYKIIIIDNLVNSSLDVLQKIQNISNRREILFFNIDIRDCLKLENLFTEYKIGLVIHFAALKAVSESIKNPLQYYDYNISGTINLLNIMKRNDCKKIIFSSSATVYGENKYPVDEESSIGVGITNPYGRTKYMIEQILQDLYISNNDWSITILRYFNPIGAHPSGLLGENPNDIPNNLFPYLLKVSIDKLPSLNIYGNDYDTPDGTCIRDFIHVVDLARGHVSATKQILNVEKDGKINIYNLGTGKGTSVKELIDTFEKVNNVKLTYNFVKRRDGDLPCVYTKTIKSLTELDWTCIYNVEDMCKHGFNFIKNNINYSNNILYK